MRDQRGVVYIETLVAFLPVFLFFLGTLQVADLSAAHLIVQHAATVAARAAVVVLPDDGVYYQDRDNQQLHQFTGLRRDDIEHAADLILGANARLDSGAGNVELGFPGAQPVPTPTQPKPPGSISEFFQQLLDTSTRGDGSEQGMRELLVARVTVKYHCLVAAFCAGDYNMIASASLVYQGARYVYEPWPDSLHNEAGHHSSPDNRASTHPQGTTHDDPSSHGHDTDDHSPESSAPTDPAHPSDTGAPDSHPTTTPNHGQAAPPPSDADQVADNGSHTRPNAPGTPARQSTADTDGAHGGPDPQSTRAGDAPSTAHGSDADYDTQSTQTHPSIVATAPAAGTNTSTASVSVGTDTGEHLRDATAQSPDPARGPAPTRGPPAANGRPSTPSASSSTASHPAGTTTTRALAANPRAASRPSPQSVIAAAAPDHADASPTIADRATSHQTAARSSADILANVEESERADTSHGHADAHDSTPRHAAELRGALPRDLRNVPIVRDASLPGSTVQVHYTHDDRGVITGIEVRVGDGARARHIADHVRTVRTLQGYQGLSGRLRALAQRVSTWITGHPNAGPGTLAWETRREIEKLRGIVATRMRALESRSLTESEMTELERERAAYERQLREYEATVDGLTHEPGRGYVAARDGRERAEPAFQDDRALPHIPAAQAETREINHEDADIEELTRTPVDPENTTWGDNPEFAGHHFVRVGDVWSRTDADRTSDGRSVRRPRAYRMIEVQDEHGRVVDRRREILQLRDNGRWQQRGSENSRRGAQFEADVRALNMARAERRARREGRNFTANQALEVPIGLLREENDPATPLSAQHSGGAGFDDVVLVFEPGPNNTVTAHIRLVEAKAYTGRLSLEDFSAVTANLNLNLDRLIGVIQASDLDPQRKDAVLAAIMARDITLDVMVTPSTLLGALSSQPRSVLGNVTRIMDAIRQIELLSAAGRLTDSERDGLQTLQTALVDAYKAEPIDKDETRDALRRLETAIQALALTDHPEIASMRSVWPPGHTFEIVSEAGPKQPPAAAQ